MVNRPNVCLIVMDTARAQSALPTENPGVMPNLESFAYEGSTFTNAITTAPWTLPSHASIFTGQYTSDHRTNAGSLSFDPEVVPLAARLSEDGYETAAISNNTWISPEFGFDTGFNHFQRGWKLTSEGVELTDIVRNNDTRTGQLRAILSNLTLTDFPATVVNALYNRFYHKKYDYGAKLTNYRTKEFVSKTRDEPHPFFLFLNYLEPHLEYDPPKSYRYEHKPKGASATDLDSVNQEQWEYICGNVSMDDADFRALEALYEGELSYLDYRLGNLFEWMEEEGVLDETMIIIVGDHGENIGNHRLMDHQYCLYDTLLRVPLIIRYPDSVPEDTTVQKLVEARDIYPTVLDACGLNAPEKDEVSSHSLLECSPKNPSTTEGRDYAFAEYLVPQPDIEQLKNRAGSAERADHLDSLDRSLRCIRTEDWKLIKASDGRMELYDLESDPEESEDVKDTHPEVVSELSEVLNSEFGLVKKWDREQFNEMSGSTRSQLEDLGYI
ncbi:sulfatase [Halococcus sp. AFM35]|uniref:sulfatase n=1 Tax=Halococcus sp. AFM35 TaxID=3421653 RepID=UPI003EB79727